MQHVHVALQQPYQHEACVRAEGGSSCSLHNVQTSLGGGGFTGSLQLGGGNGGALKHAVRARSSRAAVNHDLTGDEPAYAVTLGRQSDSASHPS